MWNTGRGGGGHISFWKGQQNLELASGWLPTTIKRSTYFPSLSAGQLQTSQSSVLEVSTLQFTSGFKTSVCFPQFQ